jgi:hypothetical protein
MANIVEFVGTAIPQIDASDRMNDRSGDGFHG